MNLDYINNTELTEKIKNLLRICVFGGTSGCIQTYALICIDDDKTVAFERLVGNEHGHFMSLEDGTGAAVIFNLSPEQIIRITSDFNMDSFIFGIDYCPSTPYLYKKDAAGNYQSSPLEQIIVMDDLEDIAPDCSDVWEDLYFNDYFRECLWNNLEGNYC